MSDKLDLSSEEKLRLYSAMLFIIGNLMDGEYDLIYCSGENVFSKNDTEVTMSFTLTYHKKVGT